MTDLLAARAQMAMSLAFHIIFAVIGIAMPLLMVIAEGLCLSAQNARRGLPDACEAVGKRDCDYVCCRRGLWHRFVF